MNYSTDEACLACELLTEGGGTFHHVKTRGAGGTDHPSNLMPLCFRCHTQIHLWGLSKFAEKHKNVRHWLVLNDWYFCDFTKKWLQGGFHEGTDGQGANETLESGEA